MTLLKLNVILAVTVVIFSTSHTAANKDVKLALSGSAPYGILNQHFVFTCTVSNAAAADQYFVYLRCSKTVYKYHCIWQVGDECRQSPTFMPAWIRDRYYSVCGYGIKKPKSNVRKYQFVIKSVTKMDRNQWWCEMQGLTYKKNSNTIILTVHHLTASLSTRPHQPVYKNMFILTCKLTNAAVIKATIQFRKNTSAALNLIGTLYQHYDKCKISKDTFRGYTAKCGKGTDSGPSDTKVYVIEIAKLSLRDNGVWFCYVQDEESSKSVTSRSFKICSPLCDHGTLQQYSCTCDCEKPWIGEECEICNLQCKHGRVRNDTCTCDCGEYWTGENCEIHVCNLHCDHGILLQDSCTCVCEKHWIGEECEICNIQCTHGRVHNDTCTCDCGEYWTGENCGTEIKKSDRNGPTSAIKVPERITDGPSWSYYSSCRAFCAISCICCIHVDISQEETLKSENSRSPEINI
ncbi:uncharacterized protein LOC121386622 isoform X5 [Gigantopelta aegis]|uniref:uncharacterized protein LOC121386622 isoform X5 n=1 Tax=Gigantopelta aegis TaxID=1735272 RepID=UPI001B888C77|nr:uncharacterized protein LOC121386622 isoform X5 [Gigantopelta aegis]